MTECPVEPTAIESAPVAVPAQDTAKKAVVVAAVITLASPVVLVALTFCLPVLLAGSVLLGLYLAAPHVGRFARFVARLLLASFHATKATAPIATRKVAPVAAGLGLALVGIGTVVLAVGGVAVGIVGVRTGRKAKCAVVAAAPPVGRALRTAAVCVGGVLAGLVCGIAAVVGAVLLAAGALLMLPLALFASSVSPVAVGS